MSEQRDDRIAALANIRNLGADPYGSRFVGVQKNAALRAIGDHSNIQPGQILEGEAVRAAGRVHLFRDTGKLIFMTVRDWTGELQWALSKNAIEEGTEARRHEGTEGSAGVPPAAAATLPGSHAAAEEKGESPWPAGDVAWQLAKALHLGDIVGAEGKLGRTKKGELTLWVDRFRMLSKAVRPPPEKWHGLTDVEARYRKRYVDLLANADSQRQFVLRARIIDYIRGVLHQRGFIEVDTPVLQPLYGGAAARPFTTHHNALDMKLYLRISPELYLKRCLVGGLERVYEFARCFRNEGISPRHNPEFTMLELYQAYGDYHDMMEITEAIIAGAARDVIGTYQIGTKARRHEGTEGSAGVSPAVGNVGASPTIQESGDGSAPSVPSCLRASVPDFIDFTPPWPRRRYADLVREHAGIDIADSDAVFAKARELGIPVLLTQGHEPNPEKPGYDRPLRIDTAVAINRIFEHCVEDKLINPTFVIDYPAPLCPLTKRHPTDPRYALRFECFINGMEMGNAYSELNDPKIQHDTFSAQLRGEGDETMAIMDEDYVEALEHAMPPAGGLGIGIDRMIMLLTGSESIREVLLFPLQRPQG
ncbi:MAG: lysine--tRNA ligase [Planctomycetes bacterium]|nr:lysine--tRNA ligase [Planctomycetota bacterium]